MHIGRLWHLENHSECFVSRWHGLIILRAEGGCQYAASAQDCTRSHLCTLPAMQNCGAAICTGIAPTCFSRNKLVWGACWECKMTPASGVAKRNGHRCAVCFYKQWQDNPRRVDDIGAPCMSPACIAILTQTRREFESSSQSLNRLNDLLGSAPSAAAAASCDVPAAAPPPPPPTAVTPTTSWGAAVSQHPVCAEPAQAALPPFPTPSPQVKAPPPPCPETADKAFAAARIAHLEERVEQLTQQLEELREEMLQLRAIVLI